MILGSFLLFLILITQNNALVFVDGDLYRLTSLSDGNVFTISGKAGTAGTNVTTEPWNDGPNQKWLAISAVSESERFILIPKWQSWDWSKFSKDSLKDRKDHLPDFTIALTDDTTKGIVNQKGFTGKNPQQWKRIDASNGAVLIKNIESEHCISNPGESKKKDSGVKKVVQKVSNIFSHKDKKPIPGNLHTVTCSATDQSQQWKLEKVS